MRSSLCFAVKFLLHSGKAERQTILVHSRWVDGWMLKVIDCIELKSVIILFFFIQPE